MQRSASSEATEPCQEPSNSSHWSPLARLETMGSSLPAILESSRATSFSSDILALAHSMSDSDSGSDSDSDSDSYSEIEAVTESEVSEDDTQVTTLQIEREVRQPRRRREKQGFLLLPTPAATGDANAQRQRQRQSLFQEGASDPCLLAASETDEVTSLDELELHTEVNDAAIKQQQAEDAHARAREERQRRWEERARSKTELQTEQDRESDGAIDDSRQRTASLSLASEQSSVSSDLDLLSTVQLERRAIPGPPRRTGIRGSSSGEAAAESLRHRYGRRLGPCAWLLENVGTPTLQKLGNLRNSYFASWLVAGSLLVLQLNVLAVVVVKFAYSPADDHEHDSGSDSRPSSEHVCHHWLRVLALMHFVGLPSLLLVLPVLFPTDLFSLYKARDKRMVRRPYLLLCELVVTLQLAFMLYVGVNQLLNVPVIVQCHHELSARELVLFYSAAVVWLVLLHHIVLFCRFLTHLKLQADGGNDAAHTSALGACLKRLLSLPTVTKRARRVKVFKKLLYRAVARGDVYSVETLLDEASIKYGIDQLQQLYPTPVLWFKAFARSSKNPLHIAVKRGDLVLVELLLRHGLDVNVLDKVARVNFNLGLVFKICSRLLVRTQDGVRSPLKSLLCSVLLPPIHGAVAGGHVHIVRLLISRGADVNALPRASFYYPAAVLPPVFVADDPQVLQLLVAHGANFLQVATVSLTGLLRTFATPLQQSTFTLRSDLSDYLLECGGDVALTPLHEAAAMDNSAKIKRLLARGIKVDTLGESVEGVHRRTPLHWAAVVGKLEAATVLLDSSADPNAKDRDGRTPLHWAARNNHSDVVTLLLSRGAQADAVDSEGIPVVCFAAEAEGVSVAVLSSLVKAGASLRTQVKGGNTALHIALQRENRQTAMSLIKCGANMMVTNDMGKRAVDCTTSTELQFSLKKEAGTRKIMISYTHTHAQLASKIREYLETHEQLTCWMDTMDPSGIGGGAVWREEIARGIYNCSLVLSIVCDGYTKSEWCLKELALAKLIRKPVLGLIVEKDHPASMAALESLIPFKNRVSFNDFILAKRQENPRAVVFDIDDAAFAERWQVTRPLMIAIMKDGRRLDQEERDDMASMRPRKRRPRNRRMTAVIEGVDNTEASDDGAGTSGLEESEDEAMAALEAPTVQEEPRCIRIYSPLGAESALRTRLQADLEGFGFPCRNLEEAQLVEQLNTCHAVLLLVEMPALVGEKGSPERKQNKQARQQITATMTRIVMAAQTVNPRKRVYPVLVQPNFLDLSKLYTLARSELFYFVDGGGWSRSVARLVTQLRQKQERASTGAVATPGIAS